MGGGVISMSKQREVKIHKKLPYKFLTVARKFRTSVSSVNNIKLSATVNNYQPVQLSTLKILP